MLLMHLPVKKKCLFGWFTIQIILKHINDCSVGTVSYHFSLDQMWADMLTRSCSIPVQQPSVTKSLCLDQIFYKEREETQDLIMSEIMLVSSMTFPHLLSRNFRGKGCQWILENVFTIAWLYNIYCESSTTHDDHHWSCWYCWVINYHCWLAQCEDSGLQW